MILLITILLLVLLGFAILAGVSITVSQKLFGKPSQFLLHQIMFGFIPGGILAFMAYKINLSFLKKISLPLLLIILTCMILVFVPTIGSLLGGARRWISFGPIGFQPSEFLKLFFILYLSAWLAKHQQNQKRLFWPLIIILSAICLLLIFQPDISTLIILASVALAIYFAATTPLHQTGALIAAGIVGLVILVALAPYRLNRLTVFFQPETQPLGMGYQLRQGLITVGSGGLTGRGLGLSVQKFSFLPQPMTDSIFAIFSEETGFVGSLILIILFLVFAWQGLKIAKKSPDAFLGLIAVGITVWITLQALINIGSITGILPITGIPLPFTSYGSSHLVAELIAVGLLLNISKHSLKNNSNS